MHRTERQKKSGEKCRAGKQDQGMHERGKLFAAKTKVILMIIDHIGVLQTFMY